MTKKLSKSVEQIYSVVLGRKFIPSVDAATAFAVAEIIKKYAGEKKK